MLQIQHEALSILNNATWGLFGIRGVLSAPRAALVVWRYVLAVNHNDASASILDNYSYFVL
ncbi:hypothetical protein ACFPYJ_22350 [Paenibacillus solisilvae]|uniref:Uncharacterized protein n=1 Tax=Paenibacillus solisilvae TaxID=2486751 RepID=A0ABW0W455_9BACL